MLAVAIALLLAALPPIALAQEAGESAGHFQVAGPYKASISIDPLPAAAGAVGRITVSVVNATTGEPIPGLAATLVITDPETGEASRVGLTQRADNPTLFEEAGFFFPREGDWVTRLVLEGPLGPEHVEMTVPAIARAIAGEIATGVAGPYRIVVGANPTSPVAHLGSRFTTLVLTHPEGEPVSNKTLTYEFTNPETEEVMVLVGTRHLSQPDFFQNLITFLTFGTWRFTATVDGPLGIGSIDGQIVVRENTDAGLKGTLLWASVMAFLILAGLFLARRYGSSRSKG